MKFDSLPARTAGGQRRTAEGVWEVCQSARRLEEAGEYEEAEAALADFWDGVGSEPRVAGLPDAEAAEVLLRAGAITRRINRPGVAPETLELAKDLISRGLNLFERLGLSERVAESRSELAYCYWRKGEHDNARVQLHGAVAGLPESDLKAEALLRLAVVEKSAGRTREALSILEGAAPLFESSPSRTLKGRFHLERATFLKNLGASEGKEELTDAALIEYEAAAYQFEQAESRRNLGLVENQIGFLLLEKNRLPEAYTHLDRARQFFNDLGDHFRAAQVDETRARGLIKEGKYAEAARVVSEAVRVLEKGDTYTLLAEALTTLGTAYARAGDFASARAAFAPADAAAGRTDEAYTSALILLTAVEELAPAGEAEELLGLYGRASELLDGGVQAETLARLHRCAEVVLRVVKEKGVAPASIHATAGVVAAQVLNPERKMEWEGFSLKRMIGEIEQAFAQRALRDAEGSVSRAAVLLGYKYSESLNSKLKKLGLISERLPLKTRRRSIIPKEFR
jgi:tetratricopeptide (TPR) repeat protein